MSPWEAIRHALAWLLVVLLLAGLLWARLASVGLVSAP